MMCYVRFKSHSAFGYQMHSDYIQVVPYRGQRVYMRNIQCEIYSVKYRLPLLKL